MKRIVAAVLACMLLCSCAAGGNIPSSSVGSSSDVSSASQLEKSKFDGLLHTDGRLIIGPDGNQLLIKGIALGNDVYGNRSTAPFTHHTEETYKELADMGFNSVRFYLNYGLFESDDAPYVYKQDGFDWLDLNIGWAKKYGIGIIFNMHYPQGNYQSQGNGGALWNDKSNQDRLSALWCKIAERYKDEPTVWGYGLINEPVVSWQGSKEATIAYYKSVVQRLTDDLRKVTNQAIFVEKMNGIIDEDGTGNWGLLTPEEAMVLVEGENIVYEFHHYSPYRFTHQDMDWANTGGQTCSYPDEDYMLFNIDNGWVDCLRSSGRSTDNGWEYHKASMVYKGNEAYNIGSLAVNATTLGSNGAAYFDDLVITEASPNGKEKVLISLNFDYDTTAMLYPWSKDGSGQLAYIKDVGCNKTGCIKIEGTTDDYTVTLGEPKIVFKEGYTYTVSGYIKYENNANKNASVRIDLGHATDFFSINKEYLESELMPFVNFSKKHSVPIYMGEFGACVNAFKEGCGGEIWVKDMLELCRKHSLSFNYHTYHENNFGLHTSYAEILPSVEDLNKPLYDCLVEGLKE